jgi:hypothetical protein
MEQTPAFVALLLALRARGIPDIMFLRGRVPLCTYYGALVVSVVLFSAMEGSSCRSTQAGERQR